MMPYVLWRLRKDKWERVGMVGSPNIAHCSKYEKVLRVGINPNKEKII